MLRTRPLSTHNYPPFPRYHLHLQPLPPEFLKYLTPQRTIYSTHTPLHTRPHPISLPPSSIHTPSSTQSHCLPSTPVHTAPVSFPVFPLRLLPNTPVHTIPHPVSFPLHLPSAPVHTPPLRLLSNNPAHTVPHPTLAPSSVHIPVHPVSLPSIFHPHPVHTRPRPSPVHTHTHSRSPHPSRLHPSKPSLAPCPHRSTTIVAPHTAPISLPSIPVHPSLHLPSGPRPHRHPVPVPLRLPSTSPSTPVHPVSLPSIFHPHRPLPVSRRSLCSLVCLKNSRMMAMWQFNQLIPRSGLTAWLTRLRLKDFARWVFYSSNLNAQAMQFKTFLFSPRATGFQSGRWQVMQFKTVWRPGLSMTGEWKITPRLMEQLASVGFNGADVLLESSVSGEERWHLLTSDFNAYSELVANVVFAMWFKWPCSCNSWREGRFPSSAAASALRVKLNNTNYAVLKNWPGQRLGAKSWHWFFRDFLQDKLDMEFFPVQPCLCRNEHCALAIHVDDVMYFGSKSYWHNTFLPTLMQTFSISQSVLAGIGSSISFLKRKIKRVDGGLALIPGTNVMKLVYETGLRLGCTAFKASSAETLVAASILMSPSNSRSIVFMTRFGACSTSATSGMKS